MHDILHIQGPFTFHDCAMVMDGGSKILIGLDGNGNKLEILVPQYIMPITREDWIPGRLHINGTPINVRSKEESDILNLLTTANIDAPESSHVEKSLAKNRFVIGKDIEDFFDAGDKGPKFAIRYMLKGIVDFISSDEYVIVSKKFNSIQ